MTLENKLKKISLFILIGLIFIQLGRIAYSFVFIKEDYHPDEAWSYGLSNSYYEPYIYQNADETSYSNVGEWFSSDILKRYLTVDRNHRFSYGSVFYNQSKDMHPPLYYLILHTICSFFPEKFSYFFGFSINIVVFVILQFTLYKLSLEISGSTIVGLCTCTFFGFSSGALSMFVFIRMYAMVSLFATISVLLHTKLLKDINFRNNLILTFIVTIAGSLTQHLYLVYAGALSACFCFYYLIQKKLKRLFVYAGTMLLSVGMSILIFPATINHLFGRAGKPVKYSPDWQFKLTLNCPLKELIGVRVTLGKTIAPVILLIVVICCIAVFLPVSFLFRNEKWFVKFIKSIKEYLKLMRRKIMNIKIKHFFSMPLFIFISSLVVIVIVSEIVSLPLMGSFTDRYLFIFYPSLSAALVLAVSRLVSLIIKNNRIVYLVVFGMCTISIFSSNYYYPSLYLFQGEYSIRKNYCGSDIIYITPENNYYTLTSLADHVLDSNMIYMSSLSQFTENISLPLYDNTQRTIYLIIDDTYLYDDDLESEKEQAYTDLEKLKKDALKQHIDVGYHRNEFEEMIENKKIFDKCEYMGKDYICGFEASVYRLR